MAQRVGFKPTIWLLVYQHSFKYTGKIIDFESVQEVTKRILELINFYL